MHDIIDSKEYLTFKPVEYLFPPKHFLEFLWKSEHFPRRYETKHEHSVYFIGCVFRLLDALPFPF